MFSTSMVSVVVVVVVVFDAVVVVVKSVAMQATSSGARRKLVVVGDGACGKTSLLIAFAHDEFPETHIPTVFETYLTEIKVLRRDCYTLIHAQMQLFSRPYLSNGRAIGTSCCPSSVPLSVCI